MGPVLGLLLGPPDEIVSGLCVGSVLEIDVGMTMGPQAGRISGTNQQCWVRPGRRYQI